MAYLISTGSHYHWVREITASTHGNGALKLTLHGDRDASDCQFNEAEVTIFTEDAAMVDRMIEAINAIKPTPALPTYEEALQDPAKARVLFDASKGGNVPGITEDHRFELADVFMQPA